jgi:hypothetical protein
MRDTPYRTVMSGDIAASDHVLDVFNVFASRASIGG